MLGVSQREDDVVVLFLPTEPIKLALGWSRYRDMNPVSTSLKSNGLTTTPQRAVTFVLATRDI